MLKKIVGITFKIVGLIVLFFLAVIMVGREAYTLKCSGKFAGKEADKIHGDDLFLEIERYRPIMFWQGDIWGVAKLSGVTYAYYTVTDNGYALNFYDGEKFMGEYALVADRIVLREGGLLSKVIYSGSCSRHKPALP